MNAPILNQPWEDVASDVTGAIEKAVQPLLKKAVDEVYTGLLEATQDYLTDNLAFNIASRIDVAEREAAHDRQRFNELQQHVTHLLYAIDRGYFGDVTGLKDSAFVEPLRSFAKSGFAPITQVAA